MTDFDELVMHALDEIDVGRRNARRAAEQMGVGVDELATAEQPALVIPVAANRKLSPVDLVDVGMARRRPVPRRPFCSATYVPVQQTCPRTCPFRGNGCMAQSGYTGRAVRRIEALAEGMSSYEIGRQEALALDRLCRRGVPRDGGRDGESPRDLRLHISGDVTEDSSLRVLAAAVSRWKARGGGSAWTFTHAWERLERERWRPISVLASIERPEQSELAQARSYVPAITVRTFPSTKPFRVAGSRTMWIPCPAETKKRTCVECRLCLDHEDQLYERGHGIAFAVHGGQSKKAKRQLPTLVIG